MQKSIDLPIKIKNDAKCAAIVENMYGSLKNYDRSLFLTLGTGIGGAIVMNDEIWRGKNYNAGEVGRMLIGNNKWENIASTSALIKEARRAGLDVNSGLELFKLYDEREELAIALVNRFYDLLGIGMANLVHVFNPEAIVVGGGISKREGLINALSHYMNSHLPYGFRNTAQVVGATFKNDGGMLGAYYNFIDYQKEKNNG